MAEIMCGSFSDSDEGIDESDEMAGSADMVIGVDEVIEVDSHTAGYEEGFVQNNGKRRLMCFSLILTLLIGVCVIMVTRSLSFDEVFIKDSSFSGISNLYQQSRYAVASARLSLGYHVNRVLASSVAMLFKIVNELGKGEKRTTVQFINLFDLQDSTWNEGNFPSSMARLEQVENVQEDEFEEEMDTLEEEEALAAAETSLDSASEAELLSSVDTNSADQADSASQNQETEKPEADINIDTIPLDQTSFDMITPSLFAGVVAVALQEKPPSQS